jgi:hypothetical protein
LQATVDDDLPNSKVRPMLSREALPADEEVGEVSVADDSSQEGPRADMSPRD